MAFQPKGWPDLGPLPQDLVVPITELHCYHMTYFSGHMIFFLPLIGLFLASAKWRLIGLAAKDSQSCEAEGRNTRLWVRMLHNNYRHRYGMLSYSIVWYGLAWARGGWVVAITRTQRNKSNLDPEIGKMLARGRIGNETSTFHSNPWFTCY